MKGDQTVNPKGNHLQIFIGRTDVEALVLKPYISKSQLIGEDPDAGNDRGQVEKGRQRMRWLAGITQSMHMTVRMLWVMVKDGEARHADSQGAANSQT